MRLYGLGSDRIRAASVASSEAFGTVQSVVTTTSSRVPWAPRTDHSTRSCDRRDATRFATRTTGRVQPVTLRGSGTERDEEAARGGIEHREAEPLPPVVRAHRSPGEAVEGPRGQQHEHDR